ncbi:hypothetical protein P153DRAFT_393315 [Dothidotthia symphoricarpi CBS 119687]|uniref:Uncharacterized protein n=1 Tax=Dothidotthia symphoricarpi CBS 119687 TaxID=1392245 RepID=A0A6A6APN3_9PLEO|nr:uncharacterized protein P153DRAFT_393315 [Dothidotthia symphoricarpi CBS 119687]KAF2133496.1 hypothetical protein P153DRAFT_393315 [Dothidotthia symphoricarpi CBS 119687]
MEMPVQSFKISSLFDFPIWNRNRLRQANPTDWVNISVCPLWYSNLTPDLIAFGKRMSFRTGLQAAEYYDAQHSWEISITAASVAHNHFYSSLDYYRLYRMMTRTQDSQDQTMLQMSAEQGTRSKDSPAPNLPTYNRVFWTRRISNPGPLKVGMMLRGLGLRQSDGRISDHGKPKFDNQTVKLLADAVAKTVGILPTIASDLVNTAIHDVDLDGDVSDLLNKFGAKIWGAGKDRSWLFKATDGVENYPRDLTYENQADRAVLRYYLRLWILIKAFNCLRNKSYARNNATTIEDGIAPSDVDDTEDLQSTEELLLAVKLRHQPSRSCATSRASLLLSPTDVPINSTENATAMFKDVGHNTPSSVSNVSGTTVSMQASQGNHASHRKTPLKRQVGLSALVPGSRPKTASPDLYVEDDHINGRETAEAHRNLEQAAQHLRASDEELNNLNFIATEPAKPTRRSSRKVPVLSPPSEVLPRSTPDESSSANSRLTRISRKTVTACNLGNDSSSPHTSAQQGRKKRKRSPPTDTNEIHPHPASPALPSLPPTPTLPPPNPSHLTTLFTTYLANPTSPDPTLLPLIDRAFTLLTPHLPSFFGADPQSLAFFPATFSAWLAYRRAVLSVEAEISSLRDERETELRRKIKRTRLLTALRKARDGFVAVDGGGLDAESVMCLGFGRLQRSVVESNGVEEDVRKGLQGLDQRLVELGETLGGGRWIVMGCGYVGCD